MSNASVAINSARTYLNDVNGLTWSDTILMPFLQEAHGELVQELDVNSIGVLKYQTPPITIQALALNMGSSQPSNILEPIAMQERDPNTDSESFVDMYKVDFLPEVDSGQYLTWWAWLGETIQFVGATSNREVILRYKGSLTTPQLVTDPIGVIYGERYLGPRIAQLAYDSIGKDSKRLEKLALTNLYKLTQRNVLSAQTPVRRRGYRSPKSTLGITGAVALTVPVAGSTGANMFAVTSTPPNGVLTSFAFLYYPLGIFVNGDLQPPTSYSISPIGSLYYVTFIPPTAYPTNTVIQEMYGPVAVVSPPAVVTVSNWIASSTIPNGIVTGFMFPAIPKYCSWNGVDQFQGSGYNLLTVGLGQYQVTFIDSSGNVLTPNTGDIIKAEIS